MSFKDSSSRYSSNMFNNIRKIDVPEIREKIENGLVGQGGADIPQSIVTAGTNLCTTDDDGYSLPPSTNLGFGVCNLNNISLVTKSKAETLLKDFDRKQREANSSVVTNYDSDEVKVINVDNKATNQKSKQTS